MPKVKKKIVAAGHICLDITPVFSIKEVKKINQVLIPGKLVQMKEADVHTGGSVANTGLAMKIFGADTKLIGKIGKDPFGELILNILKKYDASEGIIISEDTSTSYSIVLSPPGIDRIFLHNPGANDSFSYEDLDFDAIKDYSLFHFGYPPIMKNMYKENGKELVQIFKKADELGMATSLDMAAVDESSESGKADWEAIIKNVIPYVDFFMPSIEELGYMLDRPRYEEWLERAQGVDITTVLSISKDVKPLADKLISLGAKVIVIKCGATGIYYKTADKEKINIIESKLKFSFENWEDKEGFEESYKPKEVLSATGAGDTSIAAFLTAMLDGYSLEKCLQLAAAAGASCVSAYDALSGLEPFDKLLGKIENGWEKQHIYIK
ncbi:MAG: carbohydrate kinase family protein [Bacillota bacterium]|nr:carbohydrate kinase family protein [Bacillota bacterium]